MGNCLGMKIENIIIDFSQLGKLNELNGFRITGLINVTRDIKGMFGVSLQVFDDFPH